MSICLITNDPQRAFKDLIASPEFPSTQLRGQITRVIAISKLRARYKAFESVRQLFSSHDVFLADDRVVTMLPKLLGKVFFKSTAKRPIPVRISGKRAGEIKAKTAEAANVKIDARPVTAVELAKELQKALDSALVNLSPSTNTSVRIGKAGWTPEMIKENVTTVVEGLVTKIVPAGWRGVRALHLKGGSTAALPIWLADELWSGEGDVLEVLHGPDDNVPALDASAAAGPKLISAAGRVGTKRKRIDQRATKKETTIPVASNTDDPIAEDVQPSSKKARQDDKPDVTKEEKKKIKERLAKQKESAKQTVDGDLALSITAVAKKLRARKKRDASAADGEEKPSKKAKKQKSAEIETEQKSKSNKSNKSKPIDDDNEEGEKQTQKQKEKEKERKTHDS